MTRDRNTVRAGCNESKRKSVVSKFVETRCTLFKGFCPESYLREILSGCTSQGPNGAISVSDVVSRHILGIKCGPDQSLRPVWSLVQTGDTQRVAYFSDYTTNTRLVAIFVTSGYHVPEKCWKFAVGLKSWDTNTMLIPQTVKSLDGLIAHGTR